MAGKRGGRRPGAGRKPDAARAARQQLIEQNIVQARKSFDFLVEMRDNKEIDPEPRIRAALAILAYVIGKPRQALTLGFDPGEGQAGARTLTVVFGRPDDE